MSEKSYITSLSDKAILSEIGTFITQRRIELQITQAELAKRAVLSRSTVSLMERGESISLSNLLKLLRILDALYVLNAFKVQEEKNSTALAVQEQKQIKKRVTKSKIYPKDKRT